jgi:hypothetical protein
MRLCWSRPHHVHPAWSRCLIPVPVQKHAQCVSGAAELSNRLSDLAPGRRRVIPGDADQNHPGGISARSKIGRNFHRSVHGDDVRTVSSSASSSTLTTQQSRVWMACYGRLAFQLYQGEAGSTTHLDAFFFFFPSTPEWQS